jgi:hypothetical protein
MLLYKHRTSRLSLWVARRYRIRRFSVRAPGVRTRRQPGWRFSLHQMMMVVPLLGLLCWPLGFVVQRSVEDRKHARCAANLAALGVAMDQYHQKYGHFPPAFLPDAEGRPAHSWRVLLLEFLDPALFVKYDFNEPWDGPHNRGLISKMPACYACPNRDRGPSSATTSYVVIVGNESPFPGEATVKRSDIRGSDSGVPVILVAEAERMGIPWTEPKDLREEQMSFSQNDPSRPSLSSDDPRGAGCLFVDGKVGHVAPNVYPYVLKNMMSVSRQIGISVE